MTSPVAMTIFVVGLIVSIMVHEWGHFASARHFGMRADRFFLGFGPTLWSIRRGETEYGVKAVPAGGFVRIRGMSPEDQRRPPVADAWLDAELLAADRRRTAETQGRDLMTVAAVPDTAWARLDGLLAERGTPRDLRRRIVERTRRNAGDDAAPPDVRAVLAEVVATETSATDGADSLRHRLLRGDEGRFFQDKPAWQRAIVLAAGSAMHFTIAFVLMFLGLLALPQPTGDLSTRIADFTPDSAAAAAGLEVGDVIVAVDGRRVEDFATVRDVIRARPGEPLELEIVRGDTTVTTVVAPDAVRDEETGEDVGQLGFYPAVETERLGLGDAVYETFVGPASVPTQVVRSGQALVDVFGPQGIGSMFSQVTGDEDRARDGAISVVGAPALAGQGTEIFGGMFLIAMLASVNVFIGVFNLLPLPPLDGGHLAVLAWERVVNAVRSRRGEPADYAVDPRAVAAIALPVIVLFGFVSMMLIWLDITNPLSLN